MSFIVLDFSELLFRAEGQTEEQREELCALSQAAIYLQSEGILALALSIRFEEVLQVC